ncbi:MAG: MEKHLA domain-containing protein [Candidatus Zixiibacteriota bacterium]|nr:MAG: MEKHLA domain-containing protein [candidate division Zixibacteria bacterium]
MKVSSEILRRVLGFIFGIKHFALIASLVFFVIISIALFLIFQNAQIMLDRINIDFNQMQLVLANQAATQIDSDLSTISKELEIMARHIEGMPDRTLNSTLMTFIERTNTKGVLAAGLIDPGGELLNLQKIGDELLPFEKADISPSGLVSCSVSVLSESLPFEREKGPTIIYGVLCHQAELSGGSEGKLFAVINIPGLVKNSTEKIRSGKTGYAWVVDKWGMFLYHPESDFIGKNAFIARQEREPYISFAAINEIMKEKMLKGQEGIGTYESGWHRGIEGRITKLIAYTPVKSEILGEDNVWAIAVAAPTTEVAEAVHGVYIRHIAAEGAIIAAMFIFGILLVLYQFSLSEALKQQVSEKEKYILSILGNSLDAIVFIDNENRIKVWNRGAEKIFGYTEEEMMGHTFHKIIPPEIDAEKELNSIADEVMEKGYIRHYLAKRITRGGRRVTIDISRTLIRDEEGNVIGSTAIMKDVTEKMEFETRIYNTEKLASIGNLAAGVAHEINNPLAIILGFADLLKEKFDKDSQEYSDIVTIEENANNAKKIVENLLGFARITEGMADVFDITESINTVISIVKNTLITSKVELATEVPENLPQICGDAREFQQVIFNLINNALAAMEGSGGTLTISCYEKNDWVFVTVNDTGTGIPERIKRRIFDPFFTTKEVGKGTGLGLSLCYGIVNKHGGRLTFKSVSAEDFPNRVSGSTFIVSFPAAERAGIPGEVKDDSKNIGHR